ncbi:TetR/AcrR family transcriptional regulator [Streptosporangiaceae bacterium NEAU-GS5]|nr:TetR/AcrR family transcriptional regulator [Streptosporangiaceae bacterium NEAU-GS5]
MARPRVVDDAVILRKTVEVIGRVGPAALTLAAVAEEAGVVPGTLMQRFGSKHGLLVALARKSAEEAGGAYGHLRDIHRSPLEALRALAVRSMTPMTTPESFANHLAFLCLDLTDPELYRYALTIHNAQRGAIEELVAEAISIGELRAGVDPAMLAGAIQAIIAGTGLTWALDRQGGLPERLAQALGVLLSPHLPHPEES